MKIPSFNRLKICICSFKLTHSQCNFFSSVIHNKLQNSIQKAFLLPKSEIILFFPSLCSKVKTVLFVPYALHDRDWYAGKAKEAFTSFGKNLVEGERA